MGEAVESIRPTCSLVATALRARLDEEIARSVRPGAPLALIAIDLGPLRDRAAVAAVLLERLDLLATVSVETGEALIILPERDPAEARQVAHDLLGALG